MGPIIDILIIVVMILFVFFGYRKGLIKVALGLCAFVLAILIALIFYKPVAKQIMNNTQIDEKINETIYSKIKDINFQDISENDKNENEIIKIAENYINEAIEKSTENIGKYVADSLTITIVEAISFILLIILLRIALLVLNLLANFVGELPLIKQFNKSGGIICGIIEGFLIINCIFALVYILNPVCFNGEIQKNIEQSHIGKMVYENNFIINTVSK